ncbi:hypothetical protein T4E_7869 [Trichinella pseudospiralis]|uniref:Uncharacterized protein n=1 Tax=Trichinella pseudospiralis TaxID=6337 RepID=A0A0V0YKA2_TRIPS|nr:hypothetical protein T4E_7869 [Trichinella pseudospiralis]
MKEESKECQNAKVKFVPGLAALGKQSHLAEIYFQALIFQLLMDDFFASF